MSKLPLNLPVKRRPNWDWSGAVPDMKLHQAWCNNWDQSFGNETVVFTEKYVKQCINDAIYEIQFQEINEVSKNMMSLANNIGLSPIMVPILV